MSTLELIPKHLTTGELEAGLDEIRSAPKDAGVLELIVRRPAVNDREVLMEGELSLDEGLVGDSSVRCNFNMVLELPPVDSPQTAYRFPFGRCRCIRSRGQSENKSGATENPAAF